MAKKINSILVTNAEQYPIRAFASIGHTHDDYPVSYETTVERDAITGSARYEGVIAYVVADQTTYQLRGGTDNTDWVPLVTALGGTSHTLLADIGTNTHAQVDTHIADATLHYTQASISITESQVSDLQSYSLSTHVHAIGAITGFTDNSANWNTAFGWGDHSVAGYITGYTVTQGDVTAHQAALSITESQISDLQTYSVSTHNHDGSYIIPTDGVANRIPVFTAAAAAIGTSIFTWDGDIFTANKFLLNNTLDRLTIGDGTVAVPGMEINATAAGDPYINLQQAGVTSTILKFDDASARTELSSLADDITLRPGNVDTVTITGALSTFATAVTITGAFTSPGIDDNATAEQLQIEDNKLTIGHNNDGYTVQVGGVATTTGTIGLELGGSRAGDGICYTDFNSSTGVDYNLRILRSAGVNGASQFLHKGTGNFVFTSEDAAPIIFQTAAVTALTLNTSQVATFAANVILGGTTPRLTIGSATISTQTASIEVGTGRTGDGSSFIDLVGDTTYSDYGMRIIRGGTSAGDSTLEHRGLGSLILNTVENTTILFKTNGTTAMNINAAQDITVPAGDFRCTGGAIYAGVSDSVVGVFHAYGAGTGFTAGGRIILNTNVDYDSVINAFTIIANEDDFECRAGSAAFWKYAGTTGNTVFSSGTTPAITLTLDGSQNAEFSNDLSVLGDTTLGDTTLAGNPGLTFEGGATPKVTLTGGDFGQPDFILHGPQPRFLFEESNAAVDKKNYVFLVSAGTFYGYIYDDAYANNSQFMRVTRTGTGSGILATTVGFTASSSMNLTTPTTTIGSGATTTQTTIVNSHNDGHFAISGGSSAAQGANFLIYGGAHTNTGDLAIRNDGNTFFLWDETAGSMVLSTDTGAKTANLTLAGATGSETALFAGTVTVAGYIQPNITTTTALADITDAINTHAGKIQGAMVYNSTTDQPVYAAGNTDGSVWNDAVGTLAHTPV